ncbi:MAG: hypothetical protein J0L52_12680 [Caulobacterales bacterium]|nr:hypothetical protein [Caulobacterales bacterium]
MTKTAHTLAGLIALVMIAAFWISTVLAELFGGHGVVVLVKTAVPWGFLVLIPALAVAGATGMRLASRMRGPVIAAKRGRMPTIAATGLMILIPAALFLSFKAQSGQFDLTFYAVQALELLAGASNLYFMGRNVRDGLRLSRRFTVRTV